MRNDDYWRKGLPYLDSVTYRPITDAQQRANALLAGNIDIMHTDLPESILQFRQDNTATGSSTTPADIVGEPDMNFIMCNLSDPAMNDIRVRQAMAMAINPRQYSTVVDKGVNTPTNQPFVPNTPYYVDRRRVPGLQPEQGQGTGQAARDRDGQARGASRCSRRTRPTPSRRCNSSRTSSRRSG